MQYNFGLIKDTNHFLKCPQKSETILIVLTRILSINQGAILKFLNPQTGFKKLKKFELPPIYA